MSQCGLPNKTYCNSPHTEVFLTKFGLLENCTCHLLKSSLVSTLSRSFRSWRGFSTASCQVEVVLCTLCCQLWPTGTAKRTQWELMKATYIYFFLNLHFKLLRTSSAVCVHLYLIPLVICTTPSNSRWGYLCDDSHALPAAGYCHWLRLVLRCLAGSQMKDLWSFLSDVMTPYKFNQVQHIKYKMSHFAFL